MTDNIKHIDRTPTNSQIVPRRWSNDASQKLFAGGRGMRLREVDEIWIGILQAIDHGGQDFRGD